MFGILAMIIGEIFSFREDRKEYVYNKNEREKHHRYGTYYDYNGRERSIKNNEPCYTEITKNRDVIQKDKHGNIVRNITEDARKEEFIRRRNDPNRTETVYVWDNGIYYRHGNDDMKKGLRHIDYETGDVYVVRTIVEYFKSYTCNTDQRQLQCFIDVNTGKAVRITDFEKKKQKAWRDKGKYLMTDKEIDSFIKRFNMNEGTFLAKTECYYRDRGA